MSIAFSFETGQPAPSSGPRRRYMRKAKGPLAIQRAGSQRHKSPAPTKNKRAASSFILEAPELEFNIIQEDPSVPKELTNFIPYIPPVRTWSAPFQPAGAHPPPTMSSFPVASTLVPADIKPPTTLNGAMRAPVEDVARPPRRHTLPFHAGAQRSHHDHDHGHDHDHDHDRMSMAAPSCRLVPAYRWGTGARRVRRPSEDKDASLPRLPRGVRLIARPSGWDSKKSRTPAGPSRSEGSGVSSSMGPWGSGHISQSQVTVGAPTIPSPTDPIVRTFWNTVL